MAPRPVSWKAWTRAAPSRAAPVALLPRDVAALHGFEAFYEQGAWGQGQRIGFVEFARPDPADATRFWARYGFGPAWARAIRLRDVDRAPSDPAALGETDLDVQYAGALAPAADLYVYLVPDRGDLSRFLGALYDALWLAAQDGVRVVSISLGTGELAVASAGPVAAPTAGQTWADVASFLGDLDRLLATAGLSVFVASGDSGAYAGLPYGDTRPQPSWPAAQPGMVAVGGTGLAEPGRLRSGEVAWGGQTEDPRAPGYQPANTLPQASGGGGTSTLFAGRTVPDVAAFAGPVRVLWRGRELPVWGTSLAAPIAAALAALWAQVAGDAPSRADLAAAAQDVARGNNWNDRLRDLGLGTFFEAAPGPDLCTGAGSVRPPQP
jgi:kumamolisin